MKPPTPVPRVSDYLCILARYWIVIVCSTALSVGAGWLAHQTTDPEYQASTRVFIKVVGGAEVLDAYTGNLNAMANAVSIQQLARNLQAAQRTIDQLGLHETPAQLIQRITPVVHGAVVEIQITGDSPELARDSANSVTYNMLALVHEMADLDISVVQVDAASGVSDLRASLEVYLLLGFVLGLSLSVVMIIALGRVRDSVLTGEQAARTADEAVARRNT